VSSQEFRVHHARAKEFSEPSADSTPQTGGNYKPAECINELEGPQMNNRSTNTFDSTSDIFEIGLMAAASPEFAERMVQSLLAAAKDSKTPMKAAAAAVTRVPV
jgi:hypothetical protein